MVASPGRNELFDPRLWLPDQLLGEDSLVCTLDCLEAMLENSMKVIVLTDVVWCSCST